MPIRLSQAVIVEGKYDKIRLSSLLDATIIETNGFSIFRDKEKMELIRTLAQTCGVLLLMDSDAAGFKIRSFVAQGLPKGTFTHVYIPDIYGKERRKAAPSKEGKLGVEGLDTDTLLEALRRAGAGALTVSQPKQPITKADLFADGLSGTPGAALLREHLLRLMKLPEHLSPNALVPVLNSLLTREQYQALVLKVREQAACG